MPKEDLLKWYNDFDLFEKLYESFIPEKKQSDELYDSWAFYVSIIYRALDLEINKKDPLTLLDENMKVVNDTCNFTLSSVIDEKIKDTISKELHKKGTDLKKSVSKINNSRFEKYDEMIMKYKEINDQIKEWLSEIDAENHQQNKQKRFSRKELLIGAVVVVIFTVLNNLIGLWTGWW